MKTIKLAASKNVLVPDGLAYKVLAVKNCTSPIPGDVLLKDAVDELCNSPRWDVTIVSLNA